MAVMGTNVFLMRQYFLSIPRDIEEAARIDGAGFFTTFWRVMLPLATPALSAVAILQFQGAWNSFFWPLILLREQRVLHDPDRPDSSVRRRHSRRTTRRSWRSSCSRRIPILVLYIFFQRYFVEGIAASGVKG